MRKGFTLVELSIVMIIIGVLVGGVLSGQALVRQAKLRSVIAEVDKLRVAWNSFQRRYDVVPGDWAQAANFFPTSAGGNGDGCLSWFENTSGAGVSEISRAFQHVQLAGFLEEDFVMGNAASTAGVGYGVGDNGGKMFYSSWTKQGIDCVQGVDATTFRDITDIKSNIAIVYGKPYGAVRTEVNDALLTVRDAHYIDKKIDDENISTGAVQSANGYAAGPGRTANTGRCGNFTVTPNVYNFPESDTIWCHMAFQL